MPDDVAAPLPDMLAEAMNLADAVRAAAAEAEATRRTPPALAERIARAGIYQMYLPRVMGGPETPPLTAFRVVEELSRADGSVGWCAMIATAMSLNASRLPAEVGREMAGTPADYRAAGSARSGGQVRAVPGGFRVSGRWNFASGIANARWLYCTATMTEGDTPLRNAAGKPLLRALWVPRDAATVVDTWSVMGMRGTGSQDFVLEDVFVSERFSCLSDDLPAIKGPLYGKRTWYVMMWTPSAANALGIARGALDSLSALAATESSTLSSQLLRDRPAVQARIGEAAAILGAARAYVLSAVGAVWDRVSGGLQPTDLEIAEARLAITHAMHEAVRVVDMLFHAAGTNAITTRLRLERAFRDIHVAVQHGAALPAYFESGGKVLLGLRPEDPGW